jgi:hypothetical protein
MARGRMLNKSVSSDKAVASLINDLGPAAGLVFTWLIAHLDREGRMHGDPEVIKMPAFEKNQIGLRKTREPESLFPEPTSVVPAIAEREPLPAGIRQSSGNLPPEGKGREGKGTNTTVGLRENESAEVLEVFTHYRTYHPRAHPEPSSKSKEWRAIKARLAEKYSVTDLKLAIDGHHKSKHHLGNNERQTKYLSLELCMRDSSKVQGFMELAVPPRQAVHRQPREELVRNVADIAIARQIGAAIR